jgi:hypothetical protein
VDIWDGLRIVMRRWKVALPVFLAVAAVGIVGSGTIDGEYSANGSVILLGPNQQAAADALDPSVAQTDVNAYLTPCNTCETVARAIQLSLLGTETRQLMAEDGLSPDFTVVVESRSPIMSLSAAGDTPDGAVATLEGVIERINLELETRQTDVNAPTDQRITANVLSQDAEATGDFAGRTRARAALLAVGAVLAVIAAFAVEGVTFKRKRRRAGSDDDEHDDFDDGDHVARHGPRYAGDSRSLDDTFETPAVDANGHSDDPARYPV